MSKRLSTAPHTITYHFPGVTAPRPADIYEYSTEREARQSIAFSAYYNNHNQAGSNKTAAAKVADSVKLGEPFTITPTNGKESYLLILTKTPKKPTA